QNENHGSSGLLSIARQEFTLSVGGRYHRKCIMLLSLVPTHPRLRGGCSQNFVEVSDLWLASVVFLWHTLFKGSVHAEN
ncbi:MAG: hypothetical protein WAK33_14080, partial [Silvibacterium sp.]